MTSRLKDQVTWRLLLLGVASMMLAGACTSGTGSTTSSSVTGSTVATTSTSLAPGVTTTIPATRPTVPVPVFIGPDGFNDHTVPLISSTPEFFALARSGVSGQSAVKFTISDMSGDAQIRWLDSGFFTLHDEWYWFRLLNGSVVPGTDDEPISGMRFETVEAIYDWAVSIPPADLPYDLSWVGSQSVGVRLYSDHFYDLALNIEPRVYGLGSVIHFPATAAVPQGHWVIELEYHDDAPPAEIAEFFRVLGESLPAEIGENLEWVIRSPAQEQVAQEMAAAALPFHDRVVRFSELAEPGQVAVYNEGIAAGRLLLIGEGGKDLSDAVNDDILLLDTVPDWLPPGRALISSAPQTPLAHVNLLARNRGIPNASQAGILDDAGIRQAARVRAPAIVRAAGTDQLEIVLITEDQYRAWRALNRVDPIAAPSVDIAELANTVRLESITGIDTEDDLAPWRAIIGGKAAGLLNLAAATATQLPPDPLAITVRPYREHLRRIEAGLDAMLANSSFANSRRTRFLMLEGPAAFADFYTDKADGEFAADFLSTHPEGSFLGDILRAGGFVDYFRDAPMDRVALNDITETLRTAYGDYALSQGLRFRSSSTVEDIEGFNGAGLYDSNTGFLRPDVQLDGGDHKKSIEWALKKTWASYWGYEAFEERRRSGIAHRSGAMAVLVHARFDDPLEQANGVLTLTILPEADADKYVMALNVQHGDVSVANPDPTLNTLPEVVAARRSSDSAPIRIERVARSSLVGTDELVLRDSQVEDLFEQAQAVSLLWRDRVNGALPASQRVETLTLDFEFKDMAAGWPALAGGRVPWPARMILKQARTLEPGIRDVPQEVAQLPIPRDVLSRARLVQRVTCPTADMSAIAVQVFTDALLGPDVGYSEMPFVIAESGSLPADLNGCTRAILHSTPDQFLIELLAEGELLNLSN